MPYSFPPQYKDIDKRKPAAEKHQQQTTRTQHKKYIKIYKTVQNVRETKANIKQLG